MSYINNLLTDRTAPGPYDWRDFNRVGRAVEELAQVLAQAGYRSDVIVKTNWTRRGVPTRQELAQYIANIQALRKILVFPPEVPAAPATMRFLTWQGANAIETILLELEILLESLMRVYPRSGMSWGYTGNTWYIPETGYPTEWILAEDGTGQRYGLIVEDGVLAMLTVSGRFAPSDIRLLDEDTGVGYSLGVNSGVLYIEACAELVQPANVILTDRVSERTYRLVVASGILMLQARESPNLPLGS